VSAYWVIPEHEADYQDWLNDLMENAPEHFDGDESMEAIATQYVRALERVTKETHRIVYESGHGDTALWDALDDLEGVSREGS
jgi:hypothetical protein